MMTRIVCSAPSRIDLSGGAADIFGKCTLNCAISLRAFCEVHSISEGIEVLLEGSPVFLADVPVIKAAIGRAKAEHLNFRLLIHSQVPKASGLGGSGALTVAIIHGLNVFQNVEMNLYELAEQAQRAETDLGMLNGYQDWYAAAFGGVLFLDFQGKCNKPMEEEPYTTVEDLSGYMDLKFVVAHTGVLHSSALSNDALYQNYMKGDKKVVSLIDRLDVITREAKKAVVHKDMEKISEIVKENQEIIRVFGRSAPENEELIEAAYKGGALACKVTGAGHGGCIAAVCSGKKNQQAVRDSLLEETDAVYLVEVDKGVFAESRDS